jgi:AcrR family transcriptional regulator
MKTEKIERKPTILKVAQDLFSKFGLEKTTMDEIAKMSRMGKASIYYYFKSKESIYKEVIQKEGKILQEKIRIAINKENTPQNKLSVYFITRILSVKELVNYYSALRDNYLEHYSFIEKERAAHDVFEKTIVSNILQDGVEQGIFDIEDTHLVSEIIVVALKGLELSWTIEKSESEIRNDINMLLHVLFRGIETRK